MREIFSSAILIFCWLGPDDEVLHLAFESPEQMCIAIEDNQGSNDNELDL
jgi:hypothetical protein